ncbi:S8 family serine peptidase [Phaeocystidibacter luteus]|uniref:S8 family serine peptidase n=1 Tax=Phaeocystidibacter luteus TaxID=911197 RepID=A0A6N6RI35_9FLAO|nr:S8 family serine peptidase [Phaeocystidibacter luteus]KAB2809947.1 S8 family serine peptidase [Phaeocystidibacter luteus]
MLKKYSLLVLLAFSLNGTAQYKYWVFLESSEQQLEWFENHKNELSPAISDLALQKRVERNVSLEISDYQRRNPQLERLLIEADAKIHGYSRWLNAYSIETSHQIHELSDVIDKRVLFQLGLYNPGFEIQPVRSLLIEEVENTTPSLETHSAVRALAAAPPGDHWFDYGEAWQQTDMVKGHVLHDAGFEGRGLLIAVLDGAFYHANEWGGLQRAFDDGRVVATYDFVNNDTNVFRAAGFHGTRVWSIMCAEMDGQLVGSAPKASYALLRSEDDESETKVEEDNWIFAMEFADSIGADVINSSLGYTTFDSGIDYTPEDMDGRTAIVTYGAVMAHRKGMVVVTSAGNTGASNWRIISAPADADSVLAVGAVDSNRVVGGFSARGPSADGRVKPDIMAQGVLTAHLGQYGLVTRGNGTSFSAPVMAGFAACFWEANPTATNYQIMNWIRQSADRYGNPNSDYGYGIPNFGTAMELSGAMEASPSYVFPNPADSEVRLRLDMEGPAEYTITTIDGAVAASGEIQFPRNDYLTLGSSLSNGLYILTVTSEGEVFSTKLVVRR